MLGVPKKLIPRSEFDDLPQIHDCHTVGNMLHYTEVVGNEKIGQVEFSLEVLSGY